MPLPSPIAPLAALIAVFMAACGGSDATANNGGVVQLTGFLMTPQSGISCGVRGAGGFSGDPDSIVVQLHVVNTTADTLSIASVGVHAIIVRATETPDIGRVAIYPDTPQAYTPKPAVIRSRDGDVILRIMFATNPLCKMKQSPFVGFADFNVSVRITLTNGQYTTEYKSLQVNWPPT